MALQSEHKSLSEQYDVMKNKFEEIIGQLQQERDDKIAECEQVKTQVTHHVITMTTVVAAVYTGTDRTKVRCY